VPPVAVVRSAAPYDQGKFHDEFINAHPHPAQFGRTADDPSFHVERGFWPEKAARL
jgi:hypothetical protein